MRGMLQVTAFASLVSEEPKFKNEAIFTSKEPISVLDTRSPSPSTSTSTLSSSFNSTTTGGGGGGGSGYSDNTAVTADTKTVAVTETSTAGCGGGSWKEEWATELQPILAGTEVGLGGFERIGLELEDWESLLPESGQDPSLLRWISGEEDPSFSLKQLLCSGNSNEIEGNAALGFVDQSSFGFEIETQTPGGLANGNMVTPISSVLGSCTSLNNNSNSGRNGLVPQNPTGFSSPDQKVQIFDPQMIISQPQVQGSTMLNPLLYGAQQEQKQQFQPQPKRHNPGIISNPSSQIPKVPIFDPGHEFLLRKQPILPQIQQTQVGFGQELNLPIQHLQHKPFMVPKQEPVGRGSGEQMMAGHHYPQQQLVYDQLYKAAELILAGNFSHAQGILARLNHQLSPVGKPFQRAAFYFKEALQLPLLVPNPATSLLPRIPTPFDGMLKMVAYKSFSEISPIIQFMNFTSNQAILEAIGDAEHIHIMDFDIGFGAQWSSFMQELPRRNGGCPSLKITAFASPSTHHHVELGLMHENLTQFANDIGVNFELEVINFDSFDPNSYPMPPPQSSENEAIAVNLPIWSISSHLSMLPSILRFIRKLSPKIVVSLDQGCERTELPFSHHLLRALEYYEVLLDSIDAANVTSETANKIERFLFQPRIESIVLGRLQAPEQVPPWKNLFASAGFSPVAFSKFTEAQADYVANRSQVTGFHVEKCQGLLSVCWQHRELLSAFAWRC